MTEKCRRSQPDPGGGEGAARAGALRDPPRDRRAGRDARAGARVPARAGPSPDRGRSRAGEDADDQDDRRRARRHVRARPVHARPRARRTSSARGSTARGEGTFDTELGPVFCNFLLADEINRAPAKVQSALLEVMQERQVTIGHDTYPVPIRSSSWRRRTRSSPRARIRCRRPRSTASCSRSSSATRSTTRS